ncbi:TonB-dependent receptor [Peredibacter starrii]|uniref:TonB-dependent receptor n=1 Tax=Peredibacter starrii TaxID=28202 RepID=A0AAX4HVF8_9BACT|nr:TonB-dependent receptor [Peredibacter starrii]WPU66945.1 TonB-dependent receptor [Peredibacter starrii]
MKATVILPLALYASYSLAHETKLEEIEVIEHEETQGLVDFVPSVTKLTGAELTKKRQPSIGDTLSSEAGIQSTQFGPNASRPVIRGLDGDRVRILQNSLGTLDASTQSLDHAIPVDVLTIDQMEIVRGPMSLLYGASAVGGVVNLVTNRIHYNYEEGFFSKFLVQGETVNNGLSSAAHLNYGKDKWMFHVDGSTRNLGDTEIPGYARSSKLRQTDPQPNEAKDKLPNSFNQQDNIAVGVSKIFDRGYAGVSFNHFNTFYGSVADPEVSIDMTQNRFEFHGEYRPESSSIRKIKLKSAQSDYFHKELEGSETGTVFRNRGNETRLEGINKNGNVRGVSGIQTQIFNFSAKGEEAFLPTSDNTKLSLFTFQEIDYGKNALRFGARLENSDIKKKASDNFGPSDEKSYLGMNASLGHCYDFSKSNTLETSLSYTERAPNFQELYASGAHLATGIFEQGDSQLTKEKATAVEVTYKSRTDKNQFTASVYSQVFKNYIALNPTGVVDVDSGLFISEYDQVDALFYGLDLDNKSELKKTDKGAINLIGKFDFVRAKNTDDGSNLPRISPPRVTAGLEYATDKWTVDGEVQYVAEQTKTAPNETRTADYTLTNIGYSYNIVGNLTSLNLFARVRNLFDVEARNHVSTLKDIAPLPGRNFIAGAQFQF